MNILQVSAVSKNPWSRIRKLIVRRYPRLLLRDCNCTGTHLGGRNSVCRSTGADIDSSELWDQHDRNGLYNRLQLQLRWNTYLHRCKELGYCRPGGITGCYSGHTCSFHKYNITAYLFRACFKYPSFSIHCSCELIRNTAGITH